MNNTEQQAVQGAGGGSSGGVAAVSYRPRSFRDWHHAGHTEFLLPIARPGSKVWSKSKVDPSQVGKIPMLYRAGEDAWQGYVGWTTRRHTVQQLRVMDGWPGVGIGLHMMRTVAADIDTGDPRLAAATVEAVRRHCGPAPMRGRDGSPRCLLLYRTEEDIGKVALPWRNGDSREALEWLGQGHQAVVEGIHRSGVPYKWTDPHPCVLKLDGLTPVTMKQIHAAYAEVRDIVDMFGYEFVGKKGTAGSSQRKLSTGSSQRKSLDDPSLHAPSPQMVLDLLKVWKNDLESHDEFVAALAAIMGALGVDREQHYSDVLDWALTWEGDIDEAYVKERWNSITDSSVGWSWLCSRVPQAAFAQAQIDFATDKDPYAAIPKTEIEKALEHVVYVKKQAEYHNITNGAVYTNDREFNAAHTKIADYGSSGRQSAAAAFLNSDDARKVDTVTSRPGGELIMNEPNEFGASSTALNLWRPSAVKPPGEHVTDADVAPFLDLLDKLLGPERSPERPDERNPEREHFLDYWAFVLQYPGVKIGHAIVLVGAQGTGKDSLLRPLFEAVGVHNVASIDTNTLFGQWTYYLCHQMVYVQEIRTNGRRDIYNQIKPYITGQATRLAVNEKNRRQFFVPNIQNWVVTSNYDNAITLEDDDRRFWVHRVLNDDDVPPDAYFTKLHEWFGAGGTEKVYGWLLQRDVSRFNPMARPPMTAAKRTMLEASQPAPVRWLRELLGKAFAGRTVVTVGEVLKHAAQQDWAHQDINAKNVMAALKAEGFTRAHRVRVGRDMLPLWTRGAAAALDQDKMREQYLAESAATGAGEGTKEKEAA
jgi:Family of unknown function (DUF5906)/Bifunctional DNA primase/polymerase, N-terminal